MPARRRRSTPVLEAPGARPMQGRQSVRAPRSRLASARAWEWAPSARWSAPALPWQSVAALASMSARVSAWARASVWAREWEWMLARVSELASVLVWALVSGSAWCRRGRWRGGRGWRGAYSYAGSAAHRCLHSVHVLDDPGENVGTLGGGGGHGIRKSFFPQQREGDGLAVDGNLRFRQAGACVGEPGGQRLHDLPKTAVSGEDHRDLQPPAWEH